MRRLAFATTLLTVFLCSCAKKEATEAPAPAATATPVSPAPAGPHVVVHLKNGKTVAGSIVLTPSFQTDGGIILTPIDPPALSLTVASAAPRLLSLQVTGRTSTGFQLLVTGLATSRQITQIDLTFTATSGENIGSSRVTIAAESSFNAWYQGTASAQFGSQFTATIPITLSGDVVNVTTLVETIRSVSAILTNRGPAVNSARSVYACRTPNATPAEQNRPAGHDQCTPN